MAAVINKGNAISLRGSVGFVKDYLFHGINSVLYQRGIYPPESFIPVEQFDLTLLTSFDERVKFYLNKVLGQIEEFMLKKLVKQVSMVIIRMDTLDPIERWDFSIEYENNELNETCPKDKSLIQKEICNVLRQISASISYLPLLDTPCSFDLHLDTFPGAEVPSDWESITKCEISNGQDLKFSTFSTSFHKIDTAVVYKAND